MSIAAASFSIYAYEALKEELEQVEQLRFIFTSPTFIKDKSKKQEVFCMGTTDNMTEKEMTEEIKESRMTVRMTKEALYDFLLFHAYPKFSGFLVNILGLAIVFMGIFSYTT